jgi:hypothetical protein
MTMNSGKSPTGSSLPQVSGRDPRHDSHEFRKFVIGDRQNIRDAMR